MTVISSIIIRVLKYITQASTKSKNIQVQVHVLQLCCQFFFFISTLHLSKSSDIDINQLPVPLKVIYKLILSDQDQVHDRLYSLTTDSKIKVQMSAKEALTEWLKASLYQKEHLAENIQLKDLNELRKQRRQSKSDMNQDNQQDQTELEDKPDMDKQQLDQITNDSLLKNSDLYNLDFLSKEYKSSKAKGFGSQVRGQNFQRKGTGLGAGQAAVDQISIQEHKPKMEPFQKRIQQLYNQIQSSENNPQQIRPQSQNVLRSPQQRRSISPLKAPNFLTRQSLQRHSPVKKLGQKNEEKKVSRSPKITQDQQGQNLLIQNSEQQQSQFVIQQKQLSQNQYASQLQSHTNNQQVIPTKQELNFVKRDLTVVSEEFENQDFEGKSFLPNQQSQIWNSQMFSTTVKLDTEQEKDLGTGQGRKRNFQNQIQNPPKQRIQEQDLILQNIASDKADDQIQNLMNTVLLRQTQLQKNQAESFEKLTLQGRWNEALVQIEMSNYEQAYQCILQSNDDILLIRLLNVTGPCTKQLTQETALKLSQKIKILMLSEFWKILGVRTFENIKKNNLNNKMQTQDLAKIKGLLYEWSKSWTPQISQESVELYNSLI